MGLDLFLRETRPCIVWEGGITHNLNSMAEAAGLYQCLWRPEELGIDIAQQMIEPLRKGIETLERDKESLEKRNPENGWGNYDNLLNLARKYLAACEEAPNAEVVVSR